MEAIYQNEVSEEEVDEEEKQNLRAEFMITLKKLRNLWGWKNKVISNKFDGKKFVG